MSKEPPFFAFFASDFVSGTHYMTPAAVGSYIRLLCHQWQTGTVPADMTLCGRICGCTADDFIAVWSELQDKFDTTPSGDYQNPRLEAERQRTLEKSRKAKESADKRWHKRTDSERIATHTHTHNQNQRKIDTSKTKVRSTANDAVTRKRDSFSPFWLAVHRKVGKRAAEAAYRRAVKHVAKAKGCEPDAAEAYITEAMRRFAQTPDAHPKDRSAIHPTTWLNQGRYDDEPEAADATIKTKLREWMEGSDE